MKLTISKSDLLRAIQTVMNIVGGRTTLPILSNVLIKSDANSLFLMTTNLDLTMSCKAEAKVQKTGATTLPVKRLFAIAKELPEGDIDLVSDDKHRTTITCGGSMFVVNGQSDDEFPLPSPLDNGKTYRLEQKVLKEMLGRTSYAASTDEARQILNGVLVSFKGSKLSIVATDGRRLALAEQEVEVAKEAEQNIVLPSRTVDELLRALNDEGEVRVTVQDKQVMFEFCEVVLRSKLIEGTYPNYRQVIPQSCENRAVLERETFLAALRRVSLIGGDGMEDAVATKLSFSKNRLVISCAKIDVGEARETMAIKYSGKEVTSAFNARLMMDPLKVLTSDEVYLELADQTSPAVLKADIPFVYVLMPIRLG